MVPVVNVKVIREVLLHPPSRSSVNQLFASALPKKYLLVKTARDVPIVENANSSKPPETFLLAKTHPRSSCASKLPEKYLHARTRSSVNHPYLSFLSCSPVLCARWSSVLARRSSLLLVTGLCSSLVMFVCARSSLASLVPLVFISRLHLDRYPARDTPRDIPNVTYPATTIPMVTIPGGDDTLLCRYTVR